MSTQRYQLQYNPTNNSGNPTSQSYLFSGLQNGNNSASALNCIPVAPTRGLTWATSKKEVAQSIVLRTLTYHPDYEIQMQEIQDFLLFRELHVDTTLRESSDTLEDFYDDHLASEIGALNYIDELLAQGDYTGASSHLSAFSPATDIQQNYKDFYGFYAHFTGTGLSNGDLTDLETLAHQCPFLGGPVIYNARALYNLATGTIVLYNDDDCESIGHSKFAKEIKLQLSTEYKLYPNPAVDQITILGNREKEALQLTVFDVNGKKLLEQAIAIRNYQANLKFNLMKGVYFVSLVNQDNERSVKKLVITK